MNTKKYIIAKEFLLKEYIDNKKSSVQIAKENNCSKPTILKYLKLNNIKIRTLSEAFKGIRKSLKTEFKKGGKPGHCWEKNNGMNKGKNNPMWGKRAHHSYGDYYKNIYMRSSYEIKFANFLDCSGIKWKYESKTFDLGNTTYTPDFYLPEFNCYIEIKGWWRKTNLDKFQLFLKLYSSIHIHVLYKNNLEEMGVL